MSAFRVEVATERDLPELVPFYSRIYGPGHPLINEQFWIWQYGDERSSRAAIIRNDDGIVGHLGAALGGGIAWIMNGYLDEEFRGQGLMRAMFQANSELGPLAATNVNAAALGLYRNMRWHRYCDLQRYVIRNPRFTHERGAASVAPVALEFAGSIPSASEEHYWGQPGIRGVTLADGSTAVAQEQAGGVRFVDLVDPVAAPGEAWAAGARWADFITSWNDRICPQLEAQGWTHDEHADIPWKLDPVQEGSKGWVSYVAEAPMDREFVVRRTYSDHGRVASL